MIVLKDRFSCHKVTQQDLPLIHDWLKRPHIAEWIHGKGLQNTLDGLQEALRGEAEGIQYWIAKLDEQPLAFLISSDVEHGEPSLEKVPLDGNRIVSLDIFIGALNMTGKGLGTKLIADFLLTQFPDATDFVIDPEATNARAVHVYEKVGFRKFDEFIAPWHPVPHYRMHVSRKNLATGLHLHF
ncbi:MAG: GNAT family N-acetyltransferase [Deltaproteobacteria bacterium]|nr:GNAT family N-acetyltransferase [Deltaproteobacteria bacterium]